MTVRPEKKQMSLDALAAQLIDGGVLNVNAQDWISEWSEQWVAYIDLIGFAVVCQRSPDTVLNWIVRFHRALTRAQLSFPDVRLHQFTDAAYVVSPSAEILLKYCSDIQHLCLAMNLVSMQVPAPQWHYMLSPRITISFGLLLQAPKPPPTEQRYDGVDPESLMAGDALVRAYDIEKRTAGSLISIDLERNAGAREQTTRGARNRLRAIVDRWVEGDEMLVHDGVLDFPWLALRAEQPSTPGLWVDGLGLFWRKAEVFRRMWELHVGDYVRSPSDLAVIKHYGATQRHLALLVQMVRGQTKRQPWNIVRLDKERTR